MIREILYTRTKLRAAHPWYLCTFVRHLLITLCWGQVHPADNTPGLHHRFLHCLRAPAGSLFPVSDDPRPGPLLQGELFHPRLDPPAVRQQLFRGRKQLYRLVKQREIEESNTEGICCSGKDWLIHVDMASGARIPYSISVLPKWDKKSAESRCCRACTYFQIVFTRIFFYYNSQNQQVNKGAKHPIFFVYEGKAFV